MLIFSCESWFQLRGNGFQQTWRQFNLKNGQSQVFRKDVCCFCNYLKLLNRKYQDLKLWYQKFQHVTKTCDCPVENISSYLELIKTLTIFQSFIIKNNFICEICFLTTFLTTKSKGINWKLKSNENSLHKNKNAL